MYDVLLSVDLFGLLAKPWDVHVYGLLFSLGFLAALSLAHHQAGCEGDDPDRIVDLCYAMLMSGLVGARLVFVLTMLGDYLARPLDVLKVWRGGFVWYGGFLGAAAYLWATSRREGQPFLKRVDLVIAPMALAHSLGRLGCLASGCCYGRVTELPIGVTFPVGSLPQAAHLAAGWVRVGQPSLRVHPTQLYEAGGELVLFALLWGMRAKKRFHGQLFLTWLSLYPILRSLIEMLRGDKERGVWVLSTSQYISLAVGLGALVLAVVLVGRRRATSAAEAYSKERLV